MVAIHYEGMMCQAYLILYDRQKAEQIVQEACARFLASKKEIKSPLAWLHTTVKNLACALKKDDFKTTSLTGVPDLESKLLNPLDNLLNRETKELIRKAVLTLPDIYRNAVLLYYYDGKSAAESAKLLGISVAAFLSRLYRARKYLFGRLGGYRRDAI
jgi:RNA polymerase sigma-70 factor (ECF subfamily)